MPSAKEYEGMHPSKAVRKFAEHHYAKQTRHISEHEYHMLHRLANEYDALVAKFAKIEAILYDRTEP